MLATWVKTQNRTNVETDSPALMTTKNSLHVDLPVLSSGSCTKTCCRRQSALLLITSRIFLLDDVDKAQSYSFKNLLSTR